MTSYGELLISVAQRLKTAPVDSKFGLGLRQIALLTEIGSEDLPVKSDIFDQIQRHQLAADIAEGRCFNRSGGDRCLAGIGAKLVEKGILTAAANDMNFIQRGSLKFSQLQRRLAVKHRQTVEDAARQSGGALRHRFTLFTADVTDG